VASFRFLSSAPLTVTLAIRGKELKPSFPAIAVFVFASTSHAASFDCAKASTPVEKAICSETQLSDLDDLLMRAYKQALATATDTNALKTQQRAWLAGVRNKCQDSVCIMRAYNERLTALNSITPSSALKLDKGSKDIVLGRCHMNSCWWWKVDKMETIRSENKGNLVKAHVRTTTVDYSDSEVEKHGYPNFPPKKSKWEGVSETYIFCSKKLPTYIEWDEQRKKFIGTIPFDQDGTTSGATEGVGNLYSYICNNGKESKFEINSELVGSEIIIGTPTDIFNYPN
jgi:uncharacterized protein